MDKIIMVDGTNLVFRSYYATAYNGNFMKNSKDFPTNAIYGFVNMINKIMADENPVYMIVAFDKGKTFRHEKYKDYKAGRIQMPDELRVQMQRCKELLEPMGIKYYECDLYEADDIIGTFAKKCNDDPSLEGLIISSDKDLLQLISPHVEMKMLKSKDFIRYNMETFKEDYGIDPIRVIDLKALMGDSSDNIPGVKGIGEKTALKLLKDYGSLDGVYSHVEELSPKMQEKLLQDKENAYMSYDLATIETEIPLTISLEDILVKEKNQTLLNSYYEEFEFYSFLKKEEKKVVTVEYKMAETKEDCHIDEPVACYLEILGTNYHRAKVLGLALYGENTHLFIPRELLKETFSMFGNHIVATYDLKKVNVALQWLGIEYNELPFDMMIAGYLLDDNIKDDIAYLATTLGYSIHFYEQVYQTKKNAFLEPTMDVIAKEAISKAQFIYAEKDNFLKRLQEENLEELFTKIELPLTRVLADMEYAGVHIDLKELVQMEEELKIKIELVEKDIYNDAGCEFNISSPKQLGEILFDKLNLSHGKKKKTGYSTSVDVLNKIKGMHPIVDKILEYRFLTKLYTTYIEGLKDTILEDGKIHTIFTQTLTRTGRLSSIEPNLQNIPIRSEYGRLIRKAFVPSSNSVILGSDYSQIELRVLAHMADVEAMREAFLEDQDIHASTASDIFGVSLEAVTKDMRRIAKAVNFGIVYGISSYGLAENLEIRPTEAKQFIDHYLSTYPGISEYMEKVKKQAYLDGYVKTLMNRKRMIPELTNKNYMIRQSGERIALNTPIQGTSADIIKKAMIDIHSEFLKRNLKSKMILQVHDELVFDTDRNELEEVIKIVKDKMEKVLPLSVPLKVDIEYGNNWYQAK